jgi:hypothetical protein
MTVKERMHRLVDELPDSEVQKIYERIQAEYRAPEDQTPLTGLAALDALLDYIARNAPEEELDRFPPDFSENLDHYIYGTKKR